MVTDTNPDPPAPVSEPVPSTIPAEPPPTVNLAPPPPKSHTKSLILILGLVILISLPLIYVFRLKLSTSSSAPTPSSPVPTTVPLATPTPEALFLNIESPDSTTTLADGTVLVSGKTLPNATIVAFSDQDQAILDPDPAGHFEGTVIIGDKGGSLTITAYADSGEETSQNFTLQPSLSNMLSGPVIASLYLARSDQSEKPKKDPSNLNALKVISSESPQIQAFIKAKIEKEKINKLSPAQIKGLLEIENEGTAGGQLKNKLRKEATESGKYKLQPMKVKHASSSAVLKRHAVAGVITQINNGVITLAHPLHPERLTTIYTNANTLVTSKGNTITSVSGLTVGLRIAAVGEPSGNALLAKRIHVIPGKAKGLPTPKPSEASESAKLTPTPLASASATPKPTITPSPTATPTPIPTATPGPTP